MCLRTLRTATHNDNRVTRPWSTWAMMVSNCGIKIHCTYPWDIRWTLNNWQRYVSGYSIIYNVDISILF